MAGAALLAACGAGNLRPSWGPLPEAPRVEVQAESDSFLLTVADSLRQLPGLRIAVLRMSEGYLETAWYDTAAHGSGLLRSGRLSQQVRFRFWSDPGDPGMRRVTGEAVRVVTYDPSRPTRELERLVPSEHAAGQLVLRILGALREALGG